MPYLQVCGNSRAIWSQEWRDVDGGQGFRDPSSILSGRKAIVIILDEVRPLGKGWPKCLVGVGRSHQVMIAERCHIVVYQGARPCWLVLIRIIYPLLCAVFDANLKRKLSRDSLISLWVLFIFFPLGLRHRALRKATLQKFRSHCGTLVIPWCQTLPHIHRHGEADRRTTWRSHLQDDACLQA